MCDASIAMRSAASRTDPGMNQVYHGEQIYCQFVCFGGELLRECENEGPEISLGLPILPIGSRARGGAPEHTSFRVSSASSAGIIYLMGFLLP